MIELNAIVMAFVAGIILGMIFFSGLWMTVDRLSTSKHPVVLILVSQAIRFSLMLGGLTLLAIYGHWTSLVAATLAITLIRTLAVRRAQSVLCASSR